MAAVALNDGQHLLAVNDFYLGQRTHLSSRYFGPEVAREARAIFPETFVPRDFDIIDLRFQERGGPQLVKGGAVHRRSESAPLEEAIPIGEEAT